MICFHWWQNFKYILFLFLYFFSLFKTKSKITKWKYLLTTIEVQIGLLLWRYLKWNGREWEAGGYDSRSVHSDVDGYPPLHILELFSSKTVRFINIEEAQTIFLEELLEIRYDEESKHSSDSHEYDNLWQIIFLNVWQYGKLYSVYWYLSLPYITPSSLP